MLRNLLDCILLSMFINPQQFCKICSCLEKYFKITEGQKDMSKHFESEVCMMKISNYF